MAFTCPRCSRTSYSPADEREGYCGACRAFTGRGVHADYGCAACGLQFPVPASHSGPVRCPCGSLQPMAPVPGHVAEGTISADSLLQVTVSPGGLAADSGLSAGDWSSGEVTISHTDNQSGSPDGTDWPRPWDVGPFGDAMQWRAGDAEW